MSEFKVEQIDHVHVYVSDRRAAAEWYGRVLGMEVVEGHASWAEDDDGPLTISSDGGSTALALFRERDGERDKARRQTIAFRVNGRGFLDFVGRVEALGLAAAGGHTLRAGDVVDHEHSYSVYFTDPDGNPYELTTYDYDFVRERLAAAR